MARGMMRDVFFATPCARRSGAMAARSPKVRTDDLAAVPIKALMARNPKIDWEKLDEVYYGCANQAGEDNRNVARMALLLAGLPASVPGVTLNRLCASGLEAVGTAARAIRAGEMEFAIAGGVEFDDARAVCAGQGARKPFRATAEIYDTTIGWRFINPLMKTAIRRRFHAGDRRKRCRGFPGHARRPGCLCAALAAARRQGNRCGLFPSEIVAVEVPGGKAGPVKVDKDEHPRPDTTLEQLAKLKTPFRNPGTVTAGNASGVNDGAAAIIVASEAAVKAHGLKPRARILGMASAAVPPRIMGIGPVPATQKLMAHLEHKIGDYDLIEINEAFASQSLACLRQLGLADDAAHVNPHGGAIALGHPLGMSGARLALTAAHGLEESGGKLALATMCVGVGQGVSLALERVT